MQTSGFKATAAQVMNEGKAELDCTVDVALLCQLFCASAVNSEMVDAAAIGGYSVHSFATLH